MYYIFFLSDFKGFFTDKYLDGNMEMTQHKKRIFSLRISLVNMNKSVENCNHCTKK